jgi:hypothetical protein
MPEPVDPADAFALLALGDLGDVHDVASRLAGNDLQLDVRLQRLVETGLVVSYARPFTRSKGYEPLSEDIVPPEDLEFHRDLIDRRNKLHAHTDADAPPDIRRTVNQTFPPIGGRLLTPGGPTALGWCRPRCIPGQMKGAVLQGRSSPVWALRGRSGTRIWLETVCQACRPRRICSDDAPSGALLVFRQNWQRLS